VPILQIAPRTPQIYPGIVSASRRTRTPVEVESEGATPVSGGSSQTEVATAVQAALDYSGRLRWALAEQAVEDGEAAHHDDAAYGYWKRLLRTKISMFRRQERRRMAHSRDWSDLGDYVRESLPIRWHWTMFQLAGLLLLLRLPGGQKLFERAIGGLLRSGCGGAGLRR